MLPQFNSLYHSRKRTSKRFNRLTALLAIFLLIPLSVPQNSFAQQRTSGMLGIGGQVGSPSGLSLEFYNNRGSSWDFIAAWDLDNFIYINGHVTRKKSLNNSRAHFFFGPGAFVGVRERPGDDEVGAGVSATFGLGFPIDPFTLYFRVTPRLELTPETDGAIGGGIGLRYYF